MKIFTLSIIIIYTFITCSKIDKSEQRPAFLKIDNIEFNTNYSQQGSNSSKISDAWVYIDNKLIGIFDLPTTVPITKIGNREIKIISGIKKNGISVDRKKYPFYTEYIIHKNLKADSTYKIEPKVTYKENLYIWVEDFEDPSFKLSPYKSDTTMKRITTPANELFEGGAGIIALNSNQYQCEMRTNEPNFNNMPTNLSTPAYLELDYSCNNKVEVGILARNSANEIYERSPLITLNSTNNKWNKTYLYLPDASNFFSGSKEFEVYFKVVNSNAYNDIKVYLDNIKVIFWN